LYKTKKERTREIDLHETLPSAQEQFHIIQHLMGQITKLTLEVSHLKQNNTIRKKKLIHEHLNCDAYPKPLFGFDKWIRDIKTSFCDLQCVFDGDLTDGVQHVLHRLIPENCNDNNNIPICAFTQKSASFYIYDYISDEEIDHCHDNTWRIMSHDDFMRLYRRISHKLLQEFLQWQTSHQVEFKSNPTLNEKNMDYMCKISGIASAREDRRHTECKKWLFGVLAKDFAHNIKYDYQ
jgi:hypothetical protein